MPATDTDRRVLEVALRTRITESDELAALAHLEPEEVEGSLHRLSAAGELHFVDGVISYVSPAESAAASVRGLLEGHLAATSEVVAELSGIVGRLPALMQQWTVGELAAGHTIPIEVRHGPRAAEDTWYDLAERSSAGGDSRTTARAVLPDLSRFATSSPERTASFARTLGSRDAVQAIIPEGPIDDRLHEKYVAYREAGVEFRTMVRPPSWFWIDNDNVLALPLDWGEGWPTTVVCLRHPPIVSMAVEHFRLLWAGSRSIAPRSDEPPWVPLLRMMKRGYTLEAASRTLGINPRTGRRRVARGMEHYGVATLFALGVAWGADVERSSPRI